MDACVLKMASLPSVLAGFVVNGVVVATGQGTKCLPEPIPTHSISDSHAEVLARKGLLRFIMAQMVSCLDEKDSIFVRVESKFVLKVGVTFDMYISMAPCGDASIRALESSQLSALESNPYQIPETIPLERRDKKRKRSSILEEAMASGHVLRGRENYQAIGKLRTKPGRLDAPDTLCMSCSDKIAKWNAIGLQGAFLTHLMDPIYLTSITIGGTCFLDELKRGLVDRVSGFEVGVYSSHAPELIISQLSPPSVTSELCSSWTVGDAAHEIIVGGFKQGVAKKNRSNPKVWPNVSKMNLYNEFSQLWTRVHSNQVKGYAEMKESAVEYQAAKQALYKSHLKGWIQSTHRI